MKCPSEALFLSNPRVASAVIGGRDQENCLSVVKLPMKLAAIKTKVAAKQGNHFNQCGELIDSRGGAKADDCPSEGRPPPPFGDFGATLTRFGHFRGNVIKEKNFFPNVKDGRPPRPPKRKSSRRGDVFLPLTRYLPTSAKHPLGPPAQSIPGRPPLRVGEMEGGARHLVFNNYPSRLSKKRLLKELPRSGCQFAFLFQGGFAIDLLENPPDNGCPRLNTAGILLLPGWSRRGLRGEGGHGRRFAKQCVLRTRSRGMQCNAMNSPPTCCQTPPGVWRMSNPDDRGVFGGFRGDEFKLLCEMSKSNTGGLDSTCRKASFEGGDLGFALGIPPRVCKGGFFPCAAYREARP
ncbi:hypothetical protein RRG08_000229 [Elysia crispata]|uniref:Uncharacterized protein n=1 Tax=Elysia crispata TaxID=231223 RepID=A0AAE1AY15_9GAST|nr:hypothetical protein RRG08_000229 [Elysia crispata]